MNRQETYEETMAERRAHVIAELAGGERYAIDLGMDERYRFSTLAALMELEREGVVRRPPLDALDQRRMWALVSEVTA